MICVISLIFIENKELDTDVWTDAVLNTVTEGHAYMKSDWHCELTMTEPE